MFNFLTIIISFVLIPIKAAEDITIPNKVRFPYGDPVIPFAGLFVAIAFPVDVKNVDLFFSVNFEANYNLPSNQSNFSYPPDISRSLPSFTRSELYKALKFKLEGHGYPGEACLLRMICECSEISLDNNGILGDLINLILRPSSSLRENYTSIYEEAENFAKKNHHCKKYEQNCSISIINLITWSYNR